jgi:glycosyltransferase involved in cell wall biosynthesis
MKFIPNFSLKYLGRDIYLPPPDGRLLEELIKNGIPVRIVSFLGLKDDEFSGFKLSAIEGAELTIIAKVKSNWKLVKIFQYLVGCLNLLREIYRSKDELVYIYYPGHINLVAAFCCLVLKRPYALYVRGIWKLDGISGHVSRLVFTKARFVYATGHGFCAEIKKYNPNTEPVVPMISTPPATDGVPPRERCETLRALYVGHLKTRKGIIDCVQAVDQVNSLGRDVALKIVGGGSEQDVANIRYEIDQCNHPEKITLVGQINVKAELAKHFQLADVFLYPSYYPEGFPRVIYEAMLYKLPIVCTILPGMRGFMIDGRNCLEVPPKDPSSIIKAMLRLADDGQLTVSIGTNARADVAKYFQQFDVDTHAQQIMKHIEGVHGY